MGTRIDELPSDVGARPDHVIPAMSAGKTVKLTVGQLSTLITAVLVDNAPATLDTLNELAAALGDDPNFATTVATALAGKQPIDNLLTAVAGLSTANGQFLAFAGSDAPSSRNIVGSAEQVEGVPTGAIIERGSNANGQYVRFADGTQICWMSTSVTNQAINTPYASLYSGDRDWTFPAPFASKPSAMGSIKWGSSASWAGGVFVSSNTSVTFYVLDAFSRSAGTSTALNFVAFGRWF
jgi:hypothetical protein